MSRDREAEERWRRSFGERVAADMRAAAEAELKATTRRVIAVCVVAVAVVAWSLLHACSSSAPAPAPDAGLPQCDELPGCDDALCNAAGECVCRRPGLPPVDCVTPSRPRARVTLPVEVTP